MRGVSKLSMRSEPEAVATGSPKLDPVATAPRTDSIISSIPCAFPLKCFACYPWFRTPASLSNVGLKQATKTEVNYAHNPKLAKYINDSVGAWSATRLCKQRLPTDAEL